MIESGRYGGEMAPVDVTEYENDEAKDRNGLDEGGYPQLRERGRFSCRGHVWRVASLRSASGKVKT